MGTVKNVASWKLEPSYFTTGCNKSSAGVKIGKIESVAHAPDLVCVLVGVGGIYVYISFGAFAPKLKPGRLFCLITAAI